MREPSSLGHVLERVMDSMPMGVAVVDPQLALIGANPAFAQLLGDPDAAAPGVCLADLSDRLPSPLLDHLRRTLATGHPLVNGHIAAPPGLDPSERWVLSCYPVFEGDATTTVMFSVYPASLAGVPFNVHEALRRAEKRYTLASAASGDAVWDWHLGSDLIFWNENIATLFGHELEAHTSTATWWKDHIHPDERERVLRRVDATLASDETFWSAEYRFLRGDGTWATVVDRGAVLRDEAGRALHMVGAMQDLTQIRQAQADLEMLANASERLSESLDVEQTLRDLVHIVVPALADWAVVDLCEEGGTVRRVAVAAPTHADTALTYELSSRYPVHLDDEHGIAAVVRNRAPLFHPVVDEAVLRAIARDAQHYALLRQMDIRSYLAIPLLARGEVVGVLSLATSESSRRFGDHELRLAQDLARRTSLAVENAMLFNEAQAATARMARLQAVTAALARAATPADIADVLVAGGLDSLGASSTAIYLAGAGSPPGTARLVAARGVNAATRNKFLVLHPETGTPGSRALATGEAVWIESPEALAQAFPQMAGHPAESTSRAWAAVPIRLGERTYGVITLGLSQPTRFSPEQREFLLTLGQVAGQALERAHLFELRRKTEERLRLALEAAGIGTWELDIATEMMVGDDRTDQIVFGDERGRPMPYREVLERVHPDDRAGVERLRTELLSGAVGTPLRWVGRIVHASGEQRWVDLCGQVVLRQAPAVAPLEEGAQLVNVIGTLMDVTDAKEAEHERERLLEELRMAVAVRDEFISLASHELKTPLTAVALQLQLLLRATRPDAGPTAPDRQALQDHANSALLALGRLNELIDRLLDVTRLTAGPPLLMTDALDLGDVAREVIARFRPEADSAGVTLTLTTAGDLRGHFDRMRIDQVLSNLVNNALRYGGGAPVAVDVTREGDEVVLSVRDQGIGIAQGDRERIFNRFERAVSGARYAGLGVGLWVVAEIVRAMGGRITVDSELGRGATFTVRLPIR